MEKYKIKDTEFFLEEVSHIEVQDSIDDIKIYGWTLEYRHNSNINAYWYPCWTNRIYCSKQSAINAAIQAGLKKEFRVSPLYKMEGGILRDYKINQVLNDKPKKDNFEIKAWKLKADEFIFPSFNTEYPHKKGSVFIQLKNGSIIKSGMTSKTIRYWNSDIKRLYLSNKDLFEEVELKDEKWLYPHLLKELK